MNNMIICQNYVRTTFLVSVQKSTHGKSFFLLKFLVVTIIEGGI